MFGPYASLQPGKYRVEFYIKPLTPADEQRNPLLGIADVTSGVVVALFDALIFRSDLENDELYTVYFETSEPLNNVEYRFYFNGAEPLLIGDTTEAVEVERLEPRPPTRPLPALARDNLDCVRRLFLAGAAIVARSDDLAVKLSARWFHVRTAQELLALEHYAPEPENDGGDSAALIVVLGLPAPFGHAGLTLVGQVMNAVYGGHRRIHCATLADLREQWEHHKGRSVMLTADRPDTGLSYLLTTSNFPIFAFLDDLADVVALRAGLENQPLHETIRSLSHVCSCLIGCTASDNVHIYDSRHYDRPLSEMVATVLDALGLESGEDAIARAVQRLCATEALPADATLGEMVRYRVGGEDMASLLARRFSLSERALIQAFAASYGPFLHGRESEVVEWPLELFYSGKGEPGDRSVELIGGARHIFYGPYMHLPLGGWRALVRFEVSANFSGNDIEADIWVASAQKSITKSAAKLPEHGFFQFALEFINVDPNAVLELRVRLTRGAIEGVFAVRRVSLSPVEGLEDLPDQARLPPS